MGLAQFHIHVDASAIRPEGLEVLQRDLGFESTNFCGHPEGLPHYEPMHHLTLKLIVLVNLTNTSLPQKKC